MRRRNRASRAVHSPRPRISVMKSERIIVWLRRELRVQDNLALRSACADAREVIPLVIRDGDERADAAAKRRAHACALTSLSENIRSLGGRLIVRSGSPQRVLMDLLRSTDAGAVYLASDADPRIRLSDAAIRADVESAGKLWREFQDHALFDERKILNRSGEPYVVFSPFERAFRSMMGEIPPPLPRLRALHTPKIVPGGLPSLPDEFRARAGIHPEGEEEAERMLRNFLRDRVTDYGGRRHEPGIDGTSRLSRHLSLGTIGIRTVLRHLLEAKARQDDAEPEGAGAFLSQLIWREFYYQILAHFPHVAGGSFRRIFDRLEWSGEASLFEAWSRGETGYPIVDAAMRQLNREGWMHNRGRMIVASFLTKDLHLDWRMGERYFMRHLADADVALNNGGWQWSAGTGTDAQPWFRIFNPALQGMRFDPAGAYVWKYVPGLRNVPVRYLHRPWMMSPSEQKKAGCIIGRDYPAPVVDHGAERLKALAWFRSVRAAVPAAGGRGKNSPGTAGSIEPAAARSRAGRTPIHTKFQTTTKGGGV